ncbi:hypothetical protein GCM10027295_36170 [Pseudaeromonas pectinilytica]
MQIDSAAWRLQLKKPWFEFNMLIQIDLYAASARAGFQRLVKCDPYWSQQHAIGL